MAEKKEKPIGEVSNYFDRIQVAAIKLSSPLKVGDKIKFKGPDGEFEQEVESMQIHNKAVEKAKKGDEIGIKVVQPVKRSYDVFKA